jgi:hypothetical protein
MLRLVAPPGADGQDPPTRRKRGRRSPVLSLTTTERRHLAAALQNLRRTFGSWRAAADALGVPESSAKNAATGTKRNASPGLALRVARVAKVSVEVMLSGVMTLVGTCPTCGARPMQGGAP